MIISNVVQFRHGESGHARGMRGSLFPHAVFEKLLATRTPIAGMRTRFLSLAVARSFAVVLEKYKPVCILLRSSLRIPLEDEASTKYCTKTEVKNLAQLLDNSK